MNKEQYLNKRKELMNEASMLLDAGKTVEAEAKVQEVKDLDGEFENACRAAANIEALKDNEVVTNINNKGTNLSDGKPFAVMHEDKKEDDIYTNAWAKTMMNLRLTDDEQTRMDEVNKNLNNDVLTTGTHAILIPETIVAGIWKEVGEVYPLYADVLKTSVKGALTVLKSETSSSAAWYDEDTEIEEGSETFGKATLHGCELARDITVSWKLKEMAVDEFIPFIQSMLAEKMGVAAAYGVFSGKGKAASESSDKDEPRGIKTALLAQTNKPQVVEVESTATLTYENITNMIAKVKGIYKKGAKFYATSNFIWGTLANVKDTTGRPYFVADTTAGGVGRLFGFVVEEDDSVDTLLFGNANKGYHLNINKQMTLDQEDHKKLRTTDYIAYAIMDGDIRTEKAFAYLELKKA
ncbi:phage major capsid protein [Dielma fastidiosa]|uniref:HK97 family phage major capsid protein n=1 Tax=Dielma fastidiosa TaxID=1034346 RepID=A0A318LDM5_9FIRM|nr:phage major capsid protein [Dielma fastidiosa]PXX79737.1 HK97 family phage major capsid protein [Dielma fastidiosa]